MRRGRRRPLLWASRQALDGTRLVPPAGETRNELPEMEQERSSDQRSFVSRQVGRGCSDCEGTMGTSNGMQWGDAVLFLEYMWRRSKEQDNNSWVVRPVVEQRWGGV